MNSQLSSAGTAVATKTVSTQPIKDTETNPLKRPLEGNTEDSPDKKKMATNSMNVRPGPGGPTTNGQSWNNTMAVGGAMSGFIATDQLTVPDKMVGLLIGKGGEQILAIQAETGCKVQFAQESPAGSQERACTLTGTPDSIIRAREMISKIVSKGSSSLPDPGSRGDGLTTTIELMIPGGKAGLIIGKGGETIKQLQDQTGVKMLLVQDSNQPTFQDKPLRITGDPIRCQKARQMVLELIAEKEKQSLGINDFGPGRNMLEIPVPRSMVGVVIGKNGETIRKITGETSAKMQFKQDDGFSPHRMCVITGAGDSPHRAAAMIHELVNTAQQSNEARGINPAGVPNVANPYEPTQETTFIIPTNKCGLVVGKGGESIREINKMSGAFVGISRNPHPNPEERVLNIKGTPEQIHAAISLVCQKTGQPTPPMPTPMQQAQMGAMPGPYGPAMPGNPMGPAGYDPFAQFRPQFAQPGAPAPAPMGPIGPQAYPMPSNAAWGGAAWNQPVAAPDPTKPAIDPYYYAGAPAPMYGQPAPQQQMMPQQQQQQALVQQQQPQQQQPGYGYPTTTLNPATGQQDYSAAWAEYYRSQGMHQQAQAVLAQAGLLQQQGHM